MKLILNCTMFGDRNEFSANSATHNLPRLVVRYTEHYESIYVMLCYF